VPSVAEDSPQINIEEVEDISYKSEEEDALSGYQTDSESSDEEMEDLMELDESKAGEEEVKEEEADTQEVPIFEDKPKDLFVEGRYLYLITGIY